MNQYPCSALLVDDYALNREFVEEMLKRFGCDVTSCTTGKEGLETAKKKKFDIIFLDVQLPEMDGLTVAREIRKDAKGKDVPIIAVTANTMDGDKEKCLEAGMNDYIPKPVQPGDLEAILEKYIGN